MVRNVEEVRIQLATQMLEASFSNAPSNWVAVNAKKGAGQIIGSCSISVHVGTGRMAAGETWTAQASADSSILDGGRYVRLQKFNGSTWESFWYGRTISVSYNDEGSGIRTETVICEEIAGLFQALTLSDGYEVGAGSPQKTGRLLGFNANETLTYSDRSASTETIAGVTTYVHSYPGDYWLAKDVLEYVLALVKDEYGITVAVSYGSSPSNNELKYDMPSIDFNGMSVFDILNFIVNPQRGLIWSIDAVPASGEDVYAIQIDSISTIALDRGIYPDLPAAANQQSVDLSTSVYQNVNVAIDAGSVVERVRAIGARPLVGITLNYLDNQTGALVKGWTADQEAAWAADANDPESEPVYRRFIINPTWDGGQYSSSAGLRNDLTESTSGDYDILTGERTHSSGTAPGQWPLLLDSRLPAIDAAGVDVDEPQTTAPFALLQESGDWVDITGHQGGSNDYSLSIINDKTSPGIILSGDADRLESALTGGGELLVTLGVREIAPLQVDSITSNYTTTPTVFSFPRTSVIKDATLEQWVVLAGTVSGYTAGSPSTLSTVATEQINRDDTDDLLAIANQAMSYYGQPYITASWSDAGTIDISSILGRVYSTITLSDGAINAAPYLSAITWNFTNSGYGTSYETKRVRVDVEGLRE